VGREKHMQASALVVKGLNLDGACRVRIQG